MNSLRCIISSQVFGAASAIAVANPVIRRDDADPGIFAEIEIDLVRLDDGLGDHARIEDGHDGAVLRRGQVEIAHRRQAPRPRHVLHDDGRIAGNVAADIARQHAGIIVVAAGGREADHDGEELALVEIVGARLRHQRQHSHQQRRKTKRPALEHRHPYRRSCSLVAVTDTIAPLAAVCCDKTLPISSKINQLRGIVAFLRDTPHIRGSRDVVTRCRERRFR